ncbi:C-Jun-amino-terminal kinase-interacting protein 1-like [Anneissia japonica]|uniref:C-Jun-amino-terminal kinase-interacting protein 1-like n=1 Tax=Anneissia japonica TaxID=1529436 RepID=UPI0014259480|nr:C-Jun-amino-terminal kinase-interacting protein 1-like [Anneissia japonica]
MADCEDNRSAENQEDSRLELTTSNTYRLTLIDDYESDGVFENEADLLGNTSFDNVHFIAQSPESAQRKENETEKEEDTALEADTADPDVVNNENYESMVLDESSAGPLLQESDSDYRDKNDRCASKLLDILDEEISKNSNQRQNKNEKQNEKIPKRKKRKGGGRKLPQMPPPRNVQDDLESANVKQSKNTSPKLSTTPLSIGGTSNDSPAENQSASSLENEPSTVIKNRPRKLCCNYQSDWSMSPDYSISSESRTIEFNTTSSINRPLLNSDNVYINEDRSPEMKPPQRKKSNTGFKDETIFTESPEVGRKVFRPTTLSLNGYVISQTHKAIFRFIPRHHDELLLDIGDPVHLDKKSKDLWYEGINLRTGKEGCFPGQYVREVTPDTETEPGMNGKRMYVNRFHLKFLGSVEVPTHKGNDILCKAMQKVVTARHVSVEIYSPAPCQLEISDKGIRMIDYTKENKNNQKKDTMRKKVGKFLSGKSRQGKTHFFSLKNVSFCGYHPANDRYFGFITKHPAETRYACHVFITDEGESAKPIATSLGFAFQRFYDEFIEFTNPTEDIYME